MSSDTLEKLEGALTGITYCKGAFLIADFTCEDGERVKVLGSMEGVSLGQPLTLYGEWTAHLRFGPQFKIHAFHHRKPATAEAIRRYLGSGLIKGIGPKLSDAIVSTFGESTLQVLDEDIEKLRTVPGVGPSRAHIIREAWEKHRRVMDIMMFLQEHEISPALSAKIYRQYRERSINVLKENPYLLIDELRGVGFKKADVIANKLGIAEDSAFRIRAGISYMLSKAMDEGHCCAPMDDLPQAVEALLAIEPGLVLGEMKSMVEEGKLSQVDEDVYLPKVYRAEQGAAATLAGLIDARVRPLSDPGDSLFGQLEKSGGLTLNSEQKETGRTALRENVLVVTGGPGTGKTTVISFLVRLFEHAGLEVELAAPTGRAAKRMEELTGRPARTIHRLLEYVPHENTFRRGRDCPLPCQAVIVDEVSMLDIFLFHRLIAALSAGCRLVLVGDHNQLPSVGPGNVLADIIRSGVVPVIHLQEVYRQTGSGHIVLNAHRINQGLLPRSGKGVSQQNKTNTDEGTANWAEDDEAAGDELDPVIDFYFIREDDSLKAEKLVIDCAARRLPRHLNTSGFESVQVISPMYRGPCGVNNLNAELQRQLNPDSRGTLIGGRLFKHGDKVMQIKNDYHRDVYNGDIGIIDEINNVNRTIIVSIAGRCVLYDFDDLDNLVLAYAISVHKSQGSEYQAVVLPLVNHHYVMLQRNLLYTAVTRAKRMMIIVGSRKALSIAVRNARVRQRRTGLVRTLRENLEGYDHVRV